MDHDRKPGTNPPKSDKSALHGSRTITKTNDAALHHSENKYSVAARGGPSSGPEAVASWSRFGLA
jgi:hypothetical protein